MILGPILYTLLLAVIVARFYLSCKTAVGRQEAHRLVMFLFFGICLHLVIVTIWYSFKGNNCDVVWDDTFRYDQSGLYLSQQFENFNFFDKKYIEGLGAHPGYSYVVAIIYWTCGHLPFMVTACNVLAVAALSCLSYFVALRIFGKEIARYTLFGNLLCPSYIPFEFYILKDTFVVLGLLFIVWGVQKAGETKELRGYLLPLSALPVLYFFRGELTIILLGVLVLNEAVSSVGKRGSVPRTLTILMVLGLCLFAGNYVAPAGRNPVDRITEISLGSSTYGGEHLPSFLDGATGVSDIAFRILGNPVGFLLFLAKSLVLLLIGPTFYFESSGAEIFYKYGRFIFWDNLTGFVKAIFVPMLIAGFAVVVRQYGKKGFIVYAFPVAWFCCLLLAQEFFRWLLPAIPFFIMMAAVGLRRLNRFRNRYAAYLLLMTCALVTNATREDSIMFGVVVTVAALAGMAVISSAPLWRQHLWLRSKER